MMEKEKAKEILLAYACCTCGEDMCYECPLGNTVDCEVIEFTPELLKKVISTVIDG